MRPRRLHRGTVAGDDSCLSCGYAAGEPLSLDGVLVVKSKYKRTA